MCMEFQLTQESDVGVIWGGGGAGGGRDVCNRLRHALLRAAPPSHHAACQCTNDGCSVGMQRMPALDQHAATEAERRRWPVSVLERRPRPTLAWSR